MEYSWGGFKPTNYDVVSKLRDIEKCFNYLDGGLTEAVGLARLAEQLLRTCRYSYCPKVVKRIAKNRNYLLWAFCSFLGGFFLSLSLISRVFWFSYWEGVFQ